ncbi:hypothetical protein GCM10023213_29820 [Prosthecobacter algae]|uniref:Uncharacterized protein n=2 Tax=Prosthecobacter algae TaxID=1144682 RepID=A0ABP9P9D0_9BACT
MDGFTMTAMNDHPLPALRNQLLSLHKLLMNTERVAYEKEEKVTLSPLKLLQMLTEDERFSWLRQLSQLVVMIDEAMEEKPPITTERKDALVAEARHLLTGSTEVGSFAMRYAAIQEREAAVAAAHAEIRKSFE